MPYLADSFEYLLRKGVVDIVLAVASGQCDWTPKTTLELDAQLERIYHLSLGSTRAARGVPFKAFQRSAPSRAGQRRPKWGCSAPIGEALAVDVDGQVYPCPTMARSYQAIADPGLDARMRMLSLDDVRDPELTRRIATLQDACRSSGLFDPQHVQHSGERDCARCRYRSDCFVCPIGRVQSSLTDINDVPAYLCAFNRVVANYRRRFPAPRTREERLRSVIERLRRSGFPRPPRPGGASSG